jgi:hypothetical protein
MCVYARILVCAASLPKIPLHVGCVFTSGTKVKVQHWKYALNT